MSLAARTGTETHGSLLASLGCASLHRPALGSGHSRQSACWAAAGQGPRGGGPEACCRGTGVCCRVWQVAVHAGVVWKPKDGAPGDWNREQDVKRGRKEGIRSRRRRGHRRKLGGQKLGGAFCQRGGRGQGSTPRQSLGLLSSDSALLEGLAGTETERQCSCPPRVHTGRRQRCWRSFDPAGCSGRMSWFA